MADLTVLHDTNGSQTTAVPHTTFVDAATIPAGSIAASTEYLVLATALFRHANSTDNVLVRVHGTALGDVLSGEYEIVANTAMATWQGMYRYNSPSTPEDIRIQFASNNTTQVTCLFSQLIFIKVADLGTLNTDWWWNDGSGLTLTTSYQDDASVTFSANGTDKFIAIGHGVWAPGSTTAQTDVTMDVDGVEIYVSEEGEDSGTPTGENRHALFMWAWTPTNASHTVKIKAKGETAAGSLGDSQVIVINLSHLFDQADVTNGTGTTALTEGAGWINLATLSVTPNTTGNFLVLGSMIQDWNGAPSADPRGRLQVNPDGSGLVSRPTDYGDDAHGAQTWDGTDQRSLVLMALQSLSSGGSRTINLDAQMANTGTADPQVFHKALAYFSVKLAGASTQTYTPALINQTAATFTPTVTTGPVFYTPALLDRTAVAHSPSVARHVHPDLVSQAAVAFAPTVTTLAAVSLALINQTAVASAPTVTTTYAVSLGLINQAAATFAPTVTSLATVALALINQAAAPFAPTITPGAVDYAPALIDRTATPFAPTVTSLATVAPALLDQTATTSAPTVTTGAVNVSLGLIDQTAATFDPTVTLGSSNIALDLLNQAAATFTPTVTTTAAVLLALTNQAAATFTPTVLSSPTWTTPADLDSISDLPELKFLIPDMGASTHFNLQLDTANTFDTGDLRDLSSDVDQTGWDFWNGSAWEPVDAAGVPAIYAGNEARYTVQTALTGTTWHRRVRAGV